MWIRGEGRVAEAGNEVETDIDMDLWASCMRLASRAH